VTRQATAPWRGPVRSCRRRCRSRRHRSAREVIAARVVMPAPRPLAARSDAAATDHEGPRRARRWRSRCVGRVACPGATGRGESPPSSCVCDAAHLACRVMLRPRELTDCVSDQQSVRDPSKRMTIAGRHRNVSPSHRPDPLLRAQKAIIKHPMPAFSHRALPLPGRYGGECVRCSGSVPKVVRSGLAAYFCSKCWTGIQERTGGSDPTFSSQRVFGRVEDD
jgi:hypothetical protein